MNSQCSYLKVYSNKSEYFTSGNTQIFDEGKVSGSTAIRMKTIKDSFSNNFLEDIMEEIKTKKDNFDMLSDDAKNNISILVDSVTSEAGRAIVALTVMQMSIKAITPEQNIRLHKGSASVASFSWINGVSMRTLDKNFVTPFLRKYNLIKLNADGFMMTRTLAENYPYTKLYKAKLRGAKEQWLNIVDLLESEDFNSKLSLKYILTLLLNKAIDFNESCDKLIDTNTSFFEVQRTTDDVINIIHTHIEESDHAARLFEVSMHSLLQVLSNEDIFPTYDLKPLSQMRSANKQHGNIGDIELLENKEIIITWDAKYGKSYLRDELDEISEKLTKHEKVETIGFVTTDIPTRNDEIKNKILDIKETYGVEIQILHFKNWIEYYIKKVTDLGILTEDEVVKKWLTAYAESLAQKRRDIAPIDEPCYVWVKQLTNLLER